MKVIARFFIPLLVLLATSICYAQTFSPQGESSRSKAVLPKTSALERTPAVKERSSSDETIDQITQAFTTKNSAKTSNANDSIDQISKALSPSNKETENDEIEAELEDDNEEKSEDIFIPEGELYRLDTPTLDGSIRGGQSFVEVDKKGRMKKVTKIFLFYDNFKILNANSKVPTCNVRFNILSTLDRKITQLDVKLVWPGLTTTLSFANVLPNTQTYYNYALLSAGCYNMDKAPNIVVNRCRVKGMTSVECADKLLWLSK